MQIAFRFRIFGAGSMASKLFVLFSSHAPQTDEADDPNTFLNRAKVTLLSIIFFFVTTCALVCWITLFYLGYLEEFSILSIVPEI
ncbi:hypothetical protein MHBO_002594 [Bonamia ostreae]|uniref:Uncharacterized protein n=1 Tax=Bonamia ostreae TaxID=126728 RepID=A0ABV2AMU7_9EUKA